MPKCCYYEKTNGQRYTLCTTDNECPKIDGDTLIGNWGVTSCGDCGTSESTEAPTGLLGLVRKFNIEEYQAETLEELIKKTRSVILIV